MLKKPTLNVSDFIILGVLGAGIMALHQAVVAPAIAKAISKSAPKTA